VTYGAEAWTSTEKEQAALIFGRKMFRRIYGPKYENGEWNGPKYENGEWNGPKYENGEWNGPKYENGEWKSRTNEELEEMRKGENIVKWIKGQRISWLVHLERMEEDRMSKKIFTQELEGTRRRGRPKKR